MKSLWPPSVPLLVLAVALTAAAATLGSTGGEAFLGFDAYPLIAASRIDSIGAFFGTFGEPLMDGRYPDGAFYRPLVHLSFAIDNARGGLDPALFHATDVAICVVAGWLTGLIAARFAGDTAQARAAAGIGAALLFVLHRCQLDVVPYAARRADGLCLLFVAATALAVLRDARPWSIAILALCALLSKESGVITVPIAWGAALTRENATARSALGAAIAPAVGVTVGLVARTIVLGGLGGHAESGAVDFASIQSTASRLWHALTSGVTGGPWVVVGLLIGIVAPLSRGPRSDGPRPVGRRATWIATVWVGSALLITFVSGRYHDWYALSLVPGFAVVAGAGLGRAVAHRRTVDRLVGVASVALIAVFAAASLRADQRDTLRVARRISADQVERFRALIEPLGPGSTATFAPWVFAVATVPGAPPVFVHAPYSLDALGDLTLSGTPVTVVGPDQPAGPQPDEVLVRLVPGPPPAAALEGPPRGR